MLALQPGHVVGGVLERAGVLMDGVTFKVFGDPVPQAGTKSVPTKLANGKTIYRKITEGGVGLLGWRQDVSKAAAIAREELGHTLTGPVRVQVQFRFAMVKSAPKWARIQGKVWHTKKPDADKLMRAIGDSLKSGGLIADDALIAAGSYEKIAVLDSWTGAIVRVSALDPTMSAGLSI